MNPPTRVDSRPFVWTVSEDKEARDRGDAYCIYLHGHLLVENLNVHDFLKMYNKLHPQKSEQACTT